MDYTAEALNRRGERVWLLNSLQEAGFLRRIGTRKSGRNFLGCPPRIRPADWADQGGFKTG